jgi:hypothetical protein
MKKIIVIVLMFLIAIGAFILGISIKDKCKEDPKKDEVNRKASLVKYDMGKELFYKFFTYAASYDLFDSNEKIVKEAKIAVVIQNLAPSVDFEAEGNDYTFDLKLKDVKDLYKSMFNEEYVPTEEINYYSNIDGLPFLCNVEGDSVGCGYFLEGSFIEYHEVPKYLYYKEDDNKVLLYISTSIKDSYEVEFKKNDDSYYLSSFSKVDIF